MSAQPVLWHYTFSNYNEKIRWTLDHRRIPHTRRDVAWIRDTYKRHRGASAEVSVSA